MIMNFKYKKNVAYVPRGEKQNQIKPPTKPNLPYEDDEEDGDGEDNDDSDCKGRQRG